MYERSTLENDSIDLAVNTGYILSGQGLCKRFFFLKISNSKHEISLKVYESF